MSKLQRFFIALLKPIILGVTVAAILLVFIPEFRQGSGINITWFQKESKAPERESYFGALTRSAPSVVNIYSISMDNRNALRGGVSERTNLGSGVVMTEDGHLLTCYHVIKDADLIYVTLQDSRRLEARIVGFDRITDLAVLKVDAENLPVMPQVERTDLRVGDVVIAIGNPLNLGQTFTQGIVSRMGRNGLANYFDYIQTDAVLNQGNSGGALVDSNGFLMGITNAEFKRIDQNRRVITSVDGVNFAVPYELAKRVMDEIIMSGTVIRGELGFEVSLADDGSSMVITEVFRNGGAARAGLRENDILLSINGISLSDAEKALAFVADSTPGTELTLEVMRNNQLIVMSVVVGAVAS
ncbi:trypsin-like peptidase domain-containing protein [Glaciecola sp. MH2013]|uniref:trypsin-like peptidase domain-containing protein n=1 Tax=Glaciecola sp. MH2013 TaxID=2785524 RepID=UPI00189CA6FC|nr:trypsin-like peptidase domain-containing protein [Glaciecola sp. MH2013]MBF7074902.1 trypsin-like peptidase domain-containing protein [Glaciecola sp. MH2013]